MFHRAPAGVKKLKQCKTYRSFDPFGIFLGSTNIEQKSERTNFMNGSIGGP